MKYENIIFVETKNQNERLKILRDGGDNWQITKPHEWGGAR